MSQFSSESLNQLNSAHPDLQKLFHAVGSFYDCKILEGERSLERQKENVAKGVSKTLDSKHVHTPALAVDVAPFPVQWPDEKGITPEEAQVRLKRFHVFAGVVLGVAHTMGLKVTWGGDWDGDWCFDDQKFHDLPHFELKD